MKTAYAMSSGPTPAAAVCSRMLSYLILVFCRCWENTYYLLTYLLSPLYPLRPFSPLLKYWNAGLSGIRQFVTGTE